MCWDLIRRKVSYALLKTISSFTLEYLKDEAYMGRTIGRVANRVRDGKFTFKGQEYELPTNCPPHNHHGGPNSTAYHDWEIVRQSVASVTFRTLCTEKLDGFPGDAKIDVITKKK